MELLRTVTLLAVLVMSTRATAIALTQAPQVATGSRNTTIWWKTDVSSTTEVGFGTSPTASFAAYPNHSAFMSNAGLVHSRTLRRLPVGRYYARVRSSDGTSSVESAEFSFAIDGPNAYPLGSVSFASAVSAITHAAGAWFVATGNGTLDSPTGGGVFVNPVTGALIETDFPEISSGPQAAVSDGAGGVIVGGAFDVVGGLARNQLARLLPDHGLDPDFAPLLEGTPVQVTALMVSGTTLYVGGLFSSVGGVPRRNAAAFDLTTGALLAWNPDVNGQVYDLEPSGATVLVAGRFTQVNGAVARVGAIEVDAVTGALTSWDPALNGDVYAVGRVSSTIYLGGAFTTVNAGTTRAYLAAVDASSALASAWNPQPSALVRTFSISGANLYVGGNFSLMGSTSRGFAAAVSLATGAVLPWNPSLSAGALNITAAGSVVYVQSASLPLAQTDATTGAATSFVFPWVGSASGSSLALDGLGNVFVGGSFVTAGSTVAHDALLKLDAATGELMPFDIGSNGSITALALVGNTLYLSGSFTQINGSVARNRAAAVDVQTGLVLPWNPDFDSPASIILPLGSTVYLGGTFSTANGPTLRSRLAAVDATTGALTPWSPSANGTVNAMVANATSLYVGGLFTTINGTARVGLAAIDLGNGALLAWPATVNTATVFGLARAGTSIYVGGAFTTANGTSRSRAAAFSESTGALTAWNPNFGGGGGVRALRVDGSRIFVVGNFATTNSGPTGPAAVVDLINGATVGTLPVFTASPILTAVDTDCGGGGVAFGGAFTRVEKTLQRNLALFDVSPVCAGPVFDAGLPAIIDAGSDAGSADASVPDAGAGGPDAGETSDAGDPDAGAPDAGETSDAGGPDAGETSDAGDPDAGETSDAGDPDAGAPDAGETSDAGGPDAGETSDAGEMGFPDAGADDGGGAASDDAGSVPIGPGRYSVGCGCQSLQQTWLIAALAACVTLLRQRKASQRRGSTNPPSAAKEFPQVAAHDVKNAFTSSMTRSCSPLLKLKYSGKRTRHSDKRSVIGSDEPS